MKILKLSLLSVVLGFSFSIYACPQDNQTDLRGSWIGSIDAGTVSLRIIFNLKMLEGGKYNATMDSPDQGAKGIPLGEVIVSSDSIVIKAPGLLGVYSGKIQGNNKISGTWTQAGRIFDLDLEKLEEEFVINRPQEPHPPFPYKLVDIEFKNEVAGISLAGTLTYPSEQGHYPAVLLVSGSGAQNRDEELMGHKPFAVIADYLSRKGIVVLRYDDRGVAKSGGSYAGSTTEDFAGDAEAGVKYLQSLDFVDPAKVGIIGHSEGGLIAYILAARMDKLAFIVAMAGPGTPGRTIIQDQTEYISRLSGVPEATIEENRLVNAMIYDIIEEIEDPETGLKRVNDTVRYYYLNKGYDSDIIDQIANNIGSSLNPSNYKWLRYFYQADPLDYFGSISCSVFALNGSKDCQVLAEVNTKRIRKGFAESDNGKVKIKIYPELNHLFQHCKTGLVNEYSAIEETISEEVLNDIEEWISGLFVE